MTARERDAKLHALDRDLQKVELTKVKAVTENKVAIAHAEAVADMEKARLELEKQYVWVEWAAGEQERGFEV